MAWRRLGDKPLSEPMLVRSLTHIRVTRPQWVNLDFNKLTSLPHLCSLKCCLVNLHIVNNNITRLDKHFFKGYKKLQVVDMNNNNLLALPDLHCVQYSLKTMKAGDNKIQSLDTLETSGIYTRLRYVAVSSNNIRNFNVFLLRHMPKLHFFCYMAIYLPI